MPFFKGIRRLNIVMAVKQHMRSPFGAGAVANDHRVPGRVAQAAVEAERGQPGNQPLRRPAALRRMCRIGRNARDAEQLEQAVEAVIEIAVGPGEHIVESGHHSPLAALDTIDPAATVTWAKAARQGARR